MTPNKQLNYARDDVFIISINNSTEKIEETEGSLYVSPMQIYIFFGKVSALYSKTHKYIDKDFSIDKKLKNIRKGLYNNRFIDDIAHKDIKPATRILYLKILDSLVNVYRSMTDKYPKVGLFPQYTLEDKRVGAVKYK